MASISLKLVLKCRNIITVNLFMKLQPFQDTHIVVAAGV